MLSKLTVCVGTQPMSAMKVMGFGYDSMAYDRFNGMDPGNWDRKNNQRSCTGMYPRKKTICNRPAK